MKQPYYRESPVPSFSMTMTPPVASPIALAQYARSWKCIVAAWLIAVIGTAILQCVVLLHPSWLAAPSDTAYFGLYDFCPESPCDWAPWQIRPISSEFEMSALFVLTATVFSLLSVFSVLLLMVLHDRHMFKFSSWFHICSWICQSGGMLIQPFAWRNRIMCDVCESSSFDLGACHMRWPFVLAGLLALDHLSLALLGFALSVRRPPTSPPSSSKQMLMPYEYVHHLPLSLPPPPEIYFSRGSMKL